MRFPWFVQETQWFLFANTAPRHVGVHTWNRLRFLKKAGGETPSITELKNSMSEKCPPIISQMIK